MSLTLNMVGGGGGLKATDAILRVIAPAQSVVTITKDSVSKSDAGHENAHDQTVYDYYFIIHASQFDSNPWTVTAVTSGSTDTKTIIINSAGEYDLLFGTINLYINGYNNSEIGGGIVYDATVSSWNGYGMTKVNPSFGTSYITMSLAGAANYRYVIINSDKTIDCSKHSKLTCNFKLTSATKFMYFGVYTTKSISAVGNTGVAGVKWESNHAAGDYTVTVNIASVTSNCYVIFYLCVGEGGDARGVAQVNRIYLEQ